MHAKLDGDNHNHALEVARVVKGTYFQNMGMKNMGIPKPYDHFFLVKYVLYINIYAEMT